MLAILDDLRTYGLVCSYRCMHRYGMRSKHFRREISRLKEVLQISTEYIHLQGTRFAVHRVICE